MTSVEVESKRARLGSYEHPGGAALPPPLSSHPGAYHHPHHSHHHPPPPPHQGLPPPHTQTSPHHSSYPPPPPPPHPPPPPQQQQQQPPPPASQPLAHPPHLHHPPPHGQYASQTAPPPLRPPSSAGENRSRPYSSHASTLPMPTHHGADSTEPSQYHHGQHYHARQISNEPMSARTPTTPSQQGQPQDVKHAPSYYHEPYRPAPDANHHAPYNGHDQGMHPPMTVAPAHDSQRSLPYPTMPHQASEGPYEPWPYNPMMTVSADGGNKRKPVRASQACESCRQKKCKCDEDKPICGNCKQNGTQCHYRDVPPPKQERTMLQVMDQIAGLAGQIDQVNHRLNQLGASAVRKDEWRGELDSAIRSTLHRELRDFRDDIKGLQVGVKRNSEYSQSPVSRSHFASPNSRHSNEIGARTDVRRPTDSQHMRDSATAYSPVGSQPSDGSGPHVKRTPQQQNSRKESIPEALDPVLSRVDPLAGQLSIPLEHSTAAHKLLTGWDTIKRFYTGILSHEDAQDYVMREETTRGNLKIFGQGEGSDGMSREEPSQYVKHGSFSDHDGSTVSTGSSTDGNWGVGFDGPITPANDTKGGLNLDGSLCLDAATLARLYRSFLSNMWIMHPFLNKERLNRTFEKFLQRYAHDHALYIASYASSPVGLAKQPPDTFNQFKAPKRKRSDPSIDDKGIPFGSKLTTEANRQPLERSMNNAMILLIVALGRVCEHKDPVPPPVADGPEGISNTGLKSPPYNTPLSAATPAGYAPGSATPDAMGRSPLSDNSSRWVGRVRNIDKIPGLAYFAYAVNILGEHHGSPDLVHVHCSLLAGLYIGQMARVIDSWRWINTACVDCQLLFKDESSFENMDPERADSIRFAYWSCLQLESDILAELTLPPSGLSRLEDRMELPKWSTLNYSEESQEHLVVHYYWAQIHIRKILNRAHSALYNSSGKSSLKNPGWTIFSADDLAVQLEEWRSILPEPLRWKDEDEPATDINKARLRGKYYGARYMIHRPFLHHMLQVEASENSSQYVTHPKTKEDVLVMARKCVEAAKLSSISFDGLEGRPVLTSIFGTAHAQFGNILVLAACAATRYRWIITKSDLEHLFQRTINFIAPLAPLAPTMKTNLRILENTASILNRQFPEEDTEMYMVGPSTSFSSSTH